MDAGEVAVAERRAGRTRFEPALRQIASRLDLPHPARARMLLEIAGDLEDSYRHYREQGLDEGAARAAALERFDLSAAALAELAAVHSTWAKRLMDALSDRGRTAVERIGLSMALAIVAALVWWRLAGTDLPDRLGPTVVPALSLTLVALAIAVRKAWRLWLTRDHAPRGLHRGLPELLLLAAGTWAAGLAGFWLEAYRATAAATLAVGPAAPQARTLLHGLLSAFATVNAATVAAIACCLAWWVLARKVGRIERAEAEALIRN